MHTDIGFLNFVVLSLSLRTFLDGHFTATDQLFWTMRSVWLISTGFIKSRYSFLCRGRGKWEGITCVSFFHVLVLKLTGSFRVPTRTGKPGKMGRHFPVREKSGNFEHTGKVRENHTKYWKTEINWDKYYLIFLVIFKWIVHFLVKWIKFSV